jgi:hypothetical protein
MTRVGDITAVLEDIDTQLKWVRNKVTESTPLETNAGAVDSLLDGAAYSIGLKERSEDAIRGIPQWVASHQDDDATKVRNLSNVVYNEDHSDCIIFFSFSFHSSSGTSSLGFLALKIVPISTIAN